MGHDHLAPESTHKLVLIQSPVLGEKHSDSESSYFVRTNHEPLPFRPNVDDLGYRDGSDHDCPELQRVGKA
jgi:hypothetical protein